MTDFHKYLEDLIRGVAHEAESKLAAEREAFTFPTARPQWAPPRPYDIEQLIMDWKMDLKGEHVDASSTLLLTVIAPILKRVVLHAADLDIKSVTDGDGQPLQWEMDPDTTTMTVYLEKEVEQGESITLKFEYVIDHPRGGLHFTNPCPEFPDIETSAWTQMQDDFARYVVPIYDNPSHKFPIETIVTVPKGYYAMSNGYLKERTENADGTETFHWVQKEPIPAYLITVAASEYVEYKEDLDGLEVSYYAHKRWDRETVYRSFGKTPDMIRFYESKLGVKFPWAKYAQVTAANFIIGGMENVSATTQTDATLHDEKAHKDYQSDGLVSHELAHMWGGDLTTCRTWSHGWLNEGWATQMQNEWKRHDLGDDEYFYEQYGKQTAYFDEDKNKYRRPIVQNKWERGSDVFDRHLYPGAAWRYYMLKHLVGEERWWKILGEWLRRNSFKSVYTHDLEALFTEMTGEDYGWFFEQWLYNAGYPECTIKCSYDEDLGHALVTIEQTQKSDDGMTPEVFRFPLTVEFVSENDERSRYTVQVSERVHSFYYPVTKKPKQIVVDPDYAVLIDAKIEKPEPMWIEQLLHGTNVVQRIKAALALGKKPTHKAIEALGEALVKDPFWGVQAEIAKVLGSIKTESALDELLKGIQVPDSRARTAVATALGQYYKNDRAFDALVKMLEDKDSYFVPSAAAASIGKTQHEKAFDILQQKIGNAPPSWHNLILQGLLNGIVNTEREEAIDIVKQYMPPGTDDFVRRLVPPALARLGKRYRREHPEIKGDLAQLLHDNSYRVQIGALLAAKDYEDPSLIPDLEKIADTAVESMVVRYAREAIRALNKKKDKTEIKAVRKSIEELEQQNRNLEDRLAKIEAMLKDDKTKK
ncbi:MAG: HEAT repeat domain-containing protein [Candidatus Thorarchaeota archaeon]|nr:HEAT repeat domain-containing protein [Candidatus Thorarchaeota archaeon]